MQLNEQQQAAVDSIYGPVMLVAGPGSGKTQVLARRIANIVEQTDTPAEAILALTFTEKAAYNMKKRLAAIMGPEGYKVNTTTFHSFANDVIQTYPEKFLFAKNLQQVDELSKLKLVQKAITECEPKRLTTLADPYYYQREIISQIANLKKEGINPEEYLGIIEMHKDHFEANKSNNPKTGKLQKKWADYEKSIEKNEELLAIYRKYQNELLNEGLYDYEDMIMFVANTLSSDDDLKQELQEKYLFVLVDEYQDTNGAQNKILMQLTDYEQPNIFVVGDEDQSIYSFQGANLKNILEFKEVFPDAKVITTKYNYRSVQEILDLATGIIEKNPERLGKFFEDIDKQLVSAGAQKNAKIRVVHAADGYQEVEYIVSEINNLINSGEKAEEIAVLFHTHRDALDLIERLEKTDIPLQVKTKAEGVNSIAVKQMLAILNWLSDPLDSTSLIEILHFDIWNIPAIDLYKLLHLYGNSDEELIEIMMSENHLLISGIEDKKKLQEISQKLLELRKYANNEKLSVFCIELINQLGILDKLQADGSIEKIFQLRDLILFIRSRESKNSEYSLTELREDISKLRENNLDFSRNGVEEFVGGVNLLTAHSAKGLEFKHVFLIRTTNGNWGNRRNRSLIKLLDLKEPGIKDKTIEKEAAENEERRLFFVALTRAKQSLTLSYSDSYVDPLRGGVQTSNPSPYLAEIPASLYEQLDLPDRDADLSVYFSNPKYQFNVKNLEDARVRDYLSGIISSSFKLSASSLNAYLKDPEQFLYEKILRVPKGAATVLELGSAIHEALELYHRKLQADNELTQLQVLQTVAAERLSKAQLLSEEILRGTNEAKTILESYYPNLESKQENIVAVEFFAKANLGEIPLTGKLDLVRKSNVQEISGEFVDVIDFKTSTPKSRNEILGVKNVAPNAKDNYRQLLFYALLAQLDPNFKWQLNCVALDYVRPNASGKFKREEFVVSSAELEEIELQIKDTWQKIVNLEFYPHSE
ncbi:MAG: ATP-dependent helicase [Candidatus Dojkabacteria bacterium]